MDKNEIKPIIDDLEELTELIKEETYNEEFDTLNIISESTTSTSTSRSTTTSTSTRGKGVSARSRNTRKARGIVKHKKTSKNFFRKKPKKILRDNNLFLLTQLKNKK